MNTKKDFYLSSVRNYLPEKVSDAINTISAERLELLCEIRLRADLPVCLIFTDKTYFITGAGRVTEFYSADCTVLSQSEVSEAFNRMCNYSVYSYSENIADGFITLDSGCRVGVYGTAVIKNGKISAVRNVRGLNIRIPTEIRGVSDPIADLFSKHSVNVLICGPPSSGKTTILKDLCRKLSDDYSYKLSVIDERAEFSGTYLGYNTDILSLYPKAEGIGIAVRTLSPEIIVCDELGDTREVRSVVGGLNSGVRFVMSIHCLDMCELTKKEQFRLLTEYNCIDWCVFLKEKSEIERIINIREKCNETDCTDDNCGIFYTQRFVHSLPPDRACRTS